jgi:protein gp37
MQAGQSAFFLQAWGGKNKKKAGRVLMGRTCDEIPVYKTISPQALLPSGCRDNQNS